MLKRFASNAGANILSGVVAAAYQLTILGLAGRTWHGAEFAAWALALSVAAIAPLFASNLSSVLTRRIVEARHGTQGSLEPIILQGGRRLGQHLAGVAVTSLICAGTWIYIRSTPGDATTGRFLGVLALLLMTNSWLLLWQVRFGQYYADERNWMPALTLALARLGGAAGMLVGVQAGQQSLSAAAIGLFVGTWTGLAGARFLLPPPSGAPRVKPEPTEAEFKREYLVNARLLAGFAVGAVSMLAIQYSIPPLMALIAPARFNAFYLASTLNTVAVGVLAAGMSALLAPLTRWNARGNTSSLRRVALLSPVVCAGSCLVVLCFCWYAVGYVLPALTVRTARAEDIRTFLALLGLQTIIRNAAAGYAMYVASSGSSRQMAAPLIIEIVLAFSIAAPLGWIYGEQALLYGLSLSGLIGSLYSSKIVVSLHRASGITLRTAFPALFGAQVGVSGLWWLFVHFNA